MAIKEWTTNYPVSQDTGEQGKDQQPDLTDGADDTRVSQIHVMRAKAHALAIVVGDESELPAGCLRERMTTAEGTLVSHSGTLESHETRVTALEGVPAPRSIAYHDETEQTTGSVSYTPVKTFRVVKDSNAAPSKYVCFLEVWGTGSETPGSDAVGVKVAIGGTDYNASDPVVADAGSIVTIKFDVTNSDSDAEDVPLDCSIQLKVSLGSTVAHVRFTEIIAEY